jgi:hypothetical protein
MNKYPEPSTLRQLFVRFLSEQVDAGYLPPLQVGKGKSEVKEEGARSLHAQPHFPEGGSI